MPRVSPFRALRYDETVAGPLPDLVAPPYDVIDDAARRGYLARSPYNVVHLTLPESDEAAAAALGGRVRCAIACDSAPDAKGVAVAALRELRSGALASPVRPLYLRPPDVTVAKRSLAKRPLAKRPGPIPVS